MKIDDAASAMGPGMQKPLHIALVTETYPPEINGVAMTLGRLVNALRHCGHRVDVIRPRQKHEAAARTTVSAFGSDDILVRGLPIPGYPELRFGLPAKSSLKTLWTARRPDIVHIATQGPLGRSARAAAGSLGLPASSGFHTNFDAYSRHYGIGWLQRPIAAMLRGFHNGTEVTLVPTHSLARSMAANGYRNVSVVARGIDTGLFNPQRRSSALRTLWEARPDDLVVAYVGRIAAEKNLDLVFAAFSEIQRARHDAKLVLVGDGPMHNALKARNPQHIFAGMQVGKALATHYASADLFLFPSLTETFGNVTVEALASGLGVVAYDYAAAGELIRHGDNGMLAALSDGNAFINGAVATATDRNLLLRTRQRAAESVAHLDWLQVGETFAHKLRAVATAHGKRMRIRDTVVVATD